MLKQWERHGVGLFSACSEGGRAARRTDRLPPVGQRALGERDARGAREELELEIGWVVARAFWSQGYAEAAAACRDHAFGSLGRDRVISLIAPENVASIRVAEKIGELYERDVDIGASVGPVGLYAPEKLPAR